MKKTNTPDNSTPEKRPQLADDPRIVAFRYINLVKGKNGNVCMLGGLKAGQIMINESLNCTDVEKGIDSGKYVGFKSTIKSGSELLTIVASDRPVRAQAVSATSVA